MTFIIGTPHRHNCGWMSLDTGGHHSKHIEADMQTCNHCQRSINLSEWKVNGAWCARCQKPVCADGPCAVNTEKFGCLPFIAYLERFFDQHGKLAQYRKLAGLDPLDPKELIVPR